MDGAVDCSEVDASLVGASPFVRSLVLVVSLRVPASAGLPRLEVAREGADWPCFSRIASISSPLRMRVVPVMPSPDATV